MTVGTFHLTTFFCRLAISILATTTGVTGENEDAAEWAASAQNFLICLEMLLFSIAHFYCFPTEEWQDGYRVKHSRGNFGDAIALGDFFSDLKMILSSNSNSKKGIVKSSLSVDGNDREGGPETITTPAAASINNTTPVSSRSKTSLRSREEGAQHEIAKVLENLEFCSEDNPAFVEAKKRLLESKILSSEFFDEIGSFDDVEWDDIEESKHSQVGSPGEQEELPASSSNGEDQAGEAPLQGVSNNAEEVSALDNSVDDAGVNEASRLLASGSNTSPLRPSFFTVVSSLMDEDHDTSILTDTGDQE